MKKVFLLSAVAIASVLFFNSCSKQSSDLTATDFELVQTLEQNNDAAFSEFLGDIDKLNDSYCYDPISTKGFGGGFIKYVADRGGAKVGAWIGSKLGAGLGVITANPVVGVVGYVGGRYVGGIAGYACASYIAELFLDGVSVAITPDNRFLPNTTHIELDSFSSFGEVHNAILGELMTNGKSYIDENGNVLSEEMYEDALAIERNLGIQDELGEEEEYRSSIISYCNDVAKAAKEKIKFNEPDDVYNAKILKAIVAQGVPEEDVIQFEQLTSKLTAPVILNSEQTIQYERDFEKLVLSSNLPEPKKVDFIITGSVAIMSTDFWE